MTVLIEVSITRWRRVVFIRLPPMTARSSVCGWIKTTFVPAARSRLASLPRRLPDAPRMNECSRSTGCLRGTECSDEVGLRQITRSSFLILEQVEVGHRVDTAIDVAPAVDRDRVVETGDRAGGGDGVGEVGFGCIVCAEGDTLAGLVVAGDHAQVRVR